MSQILYKVKYWGIVKILPTNILSTNSSGRIFTQFFIPSMFHQSMYVMTSQNDIIMTSWDGKALYYYGQQLWAKHNVTGPTKMDQMSTQNNLIF